MKKDEIGDIIFDIRVNFNFKLTETEGLDIKKAMYKMRSIINDF